MLWKRIIIFSVYVKKAKNRLQVRIANNSTMSHNEVVEGLSKFIMPVLWATDQPSHDMIIENSFQILYFSCTQTIHQIIFTINGHSIPTKKLSKAYIHLKIEFTRS